MIKTLRSCRHPETMALDADVISLEALDAMNETDAARLFFFGLYMDADAAIYQLFINEQTHKWYAVQVSPGGATQDD